jgi:toxin ParE1/3/4
VHHEFGRLRFKVAKTFGAVHSGPSSGGRCTGIWTYIAQDNLDAADRLLDRFDDLFRRLASQPFLGKSVEELAPNLRFIPIGNYLIFYRPTKDGIEIVRLLHAARDVSAEFSASRRLPASGLCFVSQNGA